MTELRITVPLSREEFIALRSRASAELRQPREQARYMLRAALLHDPPDPPIKSEVAPHSTKAQGATSNVQS